MRTKNFSKLVIIGLLAVLLTTLILSPSIDVLGAPIKTPKEQTRLQIESSFRDYLADKHLRFDGSNTSIEIFKAFIHSDSAYAKYLQKYTNLTIEENRAKQSAAPFMDISKATIEPPFKTSNVTIDNKTYQMKFSHGSLNGQQFVKVCADNGKDPMLELRLNYLTVNIMGVDVTYGEFQQFIVSYPAGTDAADFQAWFNPLITAANGLYTIAWAAIATFVGISCPPVGIAIGVSGGITSLNVVELQTIVNDQIDYGTGIWLKLENTYIYPWAVIAYRPDFSIWASHDGSNFVWAFPYLHNYWLMGDIITQEATAYTLNLVFHHYQGQIGLNMPHYVYLPVMPPGTPPEGPNPLREVTINSYDTTAGAYVNGAELNLDGYYIGTTGNTYSLTPETHQFMTSPTWHLYENNYQFFGWSGYGEENPLEVYISSPTTLTVNYVELQWVYVDAYEYGTGAVLTSVYADGVYKGQYLGWEPFAMQLPKGPHYIGTDYQLVHWGELVTLDAILVNGQPGSNDIYLSDAPVSMTFMYHFGW